MNKSINRREMLCQSTGFLASLFVLGKLDVAAALVPDDELQLAAATTFEFMLQRIVLPGAEQGEYVELTDEIRNECYEISKMLKPDNAPAIFEQAELTAKGAQLVLQFSDDVSVSFSSRTLSLLTTFLQNHEQDPNLTRDDTEEFIRDLIDQMSQPDNWIDD